MENLKLVKKIHESVNRELDRIVGVLESFNERISKLEVVENEL